MVVVRWVGVVLVLALCGEPLLGAQEAAAPPDEVILSDGSRIMGAIKQLKGGILEIATDAADGGTIKVKFSEVRSLRTGGIHTVVAADGTQVVGVIRSDGQNLILEREIGQPIPLELSSITAINPDPERVQHRFTGVFNGRVTDGNTRTKSAGAIAEYEARGKVFRLNIRGDWNYAEDEGDLSARNASGRIKYDYFFTDRAFAYVNAVFEGDDFADLNLRTSLGTGLGYQFLDKEKDSVPVSFFEEAGISFVDEDFDDAEDDRYVAARASGKLEWTVRDGVEFYHFHEIYPSLEDKEDVYVNTRTGVRFKLVENLFAKTDNLFANFQVNWKWDNTPSPGSNRTDTEYLLGVGYDLHF